VALIQKVIQMIRTSSPQKLVLELPRLIKATMREVRYRQFLKSEQTQIPKRIAEQKLKTASLAYQPLISVIIPTFKPHMPWFKECIESVLAQSYPHFEICISDDHSQDVVTENYIHELKSVHPHVKITIRNENGHICRNTNSALTLATGDYVAFLDQDDLLHPEALFHVACALQRQPRPQFIYTNEDKIDSKGVRHDPHFKSSFDRSLLTRKMFTGHLAIYNRKLMTELGGLREGTEGAQDWDLILRAIELYPQLEIAHIPQVLYHWRKHEGSTAQSLEAKDYARLAGERVVKEYIQRQRAQEVRR
jgi:glycosyltransferase involved in cell wall biosynthesis